MTDLVVDGQRTRGKDVRDQNGTFLFAYTLILSNMLSSNGGFGHCQHRQELVGSIGFR